MGIRFSPGCACCEGGNILYWFNRKYFNYSATIDLHVYDGLDVNITGVVQENNNTYSTFLGPTYQNIKDFNLIYLVAPSNGQIIPWWNDVLSLNFNTYLRVVFVGYPVLPVNSTSPADYNYYNNTYAPDTGLTWQNIVLNNISQISPVFQDDLTDGVSALSFEYSGQINGGKILSNGYQVTNGVITGTAPLPWLAHKVKIPQKLDFVGSGSWLVFNRSIYKNNTTFVHNLVQKLPN